MLKYESSIQSKNTSAFYSLHRYVLPGLKYLFKQYIPEIWQLGIFVYIPGYWSGASVGDQLFLNVWKQVSPKPRRKRNCSIHLYIDLTEVFVLHWLFFPGCLEIILFLSPSSYLDIVHRLTYLWSLKVSPYLLRVISPVLCVLCNPVWLSVHISFTSFHVSFFSWLLYLYILPASSL